MIEITFSFPLKNPKEIAKSVDVDNLGFENVSVWSENDVIHGRVWGERASELKNVVDDLIACIMAVERI
ncbi:MAG: KEOPS complex subunit Pcc1 [Candidatus Methanofastidiosia archaeon]